MCFTTTKETALSPFNFAHPVDGDTSFQTTSWQSVPSQSHQSTVSATLASFSTATSWHVNGRPSHSSRQLVFRSFQTNTVKLLIGLQAGSQIEAGSPIQAGSRLGATWWGNVTKDRLGPCQGSNERKVTGAGMGVGVACSGVGGVGQLCVCQSEYSADLDLKHYDVSPQMLTTCNKIKHRNLYYKYPSKRKKRLHMNLHNTKHNR